MNKLITKVVGVALGLGLAVGVGAGVVAGNRSVEKVEAATEQLTFTSSSYNTSTKKVTGTNFTITFKDGSTATTWNSAIRVYGGGEITVSPNTGFKMTAATLTFTSDYAPSSSSNSSQYATFSGEGTVTSYGTSETVWSGDSTTGFTLARKTGSGHWRFTAISIDLEIDSGSGGEGGEEIADYLYTFTGVSGFSNNSLTQTLADSNYSPAWTLSSQPYYGGTTDNGLQLGSSSSPSTGGTLRTSSFSNAVTKVVLMNRAYSSGTVNVSVGGVDISATAKSVGSSLTTNTFIYSGESSLTGEIVITFTNTSRAFYFKSISISFAEAATVGVESIDLGEDISLAKGQSTTITPTISPANATNRNIGYVSSNASVASVDNTGKVVAAGIGSATITGTSEDNSSASDTLTVTVTKAIPVSLSWTKQAKDFEVDTALNAYFDSDNNVLKAKYSDNTYSSAISISSNALSIKLGNTTIAYNYVLQLSDNGKQLEIIYTEDSISVSTKVTITVGEPILIGEVSESFAGGKSYLLVNDSTSTLSATFKSLHGEPNLSVSSSNDEIIDASGSLTYDSETKEGGITISLLAYDSGMASITITISYNAKSASITHGPIIVRDSAPAAQGSHYEKVTASNELVTGQYLIVDEIGSVAFNGGLSNLDVDDNTIAVQPSNDQIAFTSTTQNAEFTIDVGTGFIQAANGKYISGTANSNALVSNDTAEAGTSTQNSISYSDGISIVSATSTLGCYATKSNNVLHYRFRYAKSGSSFVTTATGWHKISIYKFVEEQVDDDFDKALEFVNTFMHTEIDISNEGTGACISSGWYTAAKTAFFNVSGSTATGYLQNAEQRGIVADSFTDYFLRLQAWAAANGESIELSNGDYVVSTANRLTILNNDNSAVMTFVIIAIVLTTSTGAIFLLRKKKEER